MRFPRLAHRSAAAHKLHSTPQQDRMNLISGKGETSSRLPAFSLFLPGSCPNYRDRRRPPVAPPAMPQRRAPDPDAPAPNAARRRCPAIRSPRSMRRVDLDAACALCWTKSDGKGSCRANPSSWLGFAVNSNAKVRVRGCPERGRRPPPGRHATMRRRTAATRGSALRSARLGPALPHHLKYGSRAATKLPRSPAAMYCRAPRFRSVFPASSLLCWSRRNHISVN